MSAALLDMPHVCFGLQQSPDSEIAASALALTSQLNGSASNSPKSLAMESHNDAKRTSLSDSPLGL